MCLVNDKSCVTVTPKYFAEVVEFSTLSVSLYSNIFFSVVVVLKYIIVSSANSLILLRTVSGMLFI